MNEHDILEALANLDYLLQNTTDSQRLADYHELKTKLEKALVRSRVASAN